MSKVLILVVCGFCCWFGGCQSIAVKGLQQGQQSSAAEAEKLGRAFADGFYTRQPQRSLATLHPALSKLGVIPNIRNSGKSAILRLTPGTLNAFALSHNADGHIDPQADNTTIRILDSTADTVVFQLIAAKDWFDYYLAVKVADRWSLLNCVFGAYPQLNSSNPDGDQAAVEAAVKRYAKAISSGQYAQLRQTVHMDFERRTLVHSDASSWILPETGETLALTLGAYRNSDSGIVRLLGLSDIAAATRIDSSNRTEWVFLLKMDGNWLPVNSFWLAHDS